MKKQVPIPHNLKRVHLILLVFFVLVLSAVICRCSFSKDENDNILSVNKNDILFQNENPNFRVNFVKENESSYIRFETKGSNKNPFEEKKLTLAQQVEESLGLAGVKKGLKLSLKGISYNETMREKISQTGAVLPPDEQEKRTFDFQLTEQGRAIGIDDEGTTSKKTVISKDISEGIDIEYQIVSGKGLKEEIVLNELPQYSQECESGDCVFPANVFYFNLEVDEGLKLNKNITDGTYFFTDADGTYYAHFLPQYAKDNVGNKTNEVEVTIEDTEEENKYLITVVLDSEWLLSSERVFPVRIDPSIVHDTDNVFNTGAYEGTSIEDGYSKVGLKDSLNGDYTSSVIDIGENPRIKNVSVKSYGADTGDGEIPFSTTGILAQWGFNEMSGNTVSNLSNCNEACNLTLKSFSNTSQRDILLSSGWTSIYSKWGGGALMFDGIDDSVSGMVKGLSTKDIYSFETWILPLSDGYIFNSNLGSLVAENGHWKVSNGTELFDSKLTVNYYRWQHVVVIFDKNEPRVSVYVDSKNSVIENYTFSSANSDLISIGGYAYKPFFKGIIDLTRVYERALTETEIYSNTQSAYIGTEYRTSSDGSTWSEWKSTIEKPVSTNEAIVTMSKETYSLPVLVELMSTTNSRLLSFLMAGDEKGDDLNIELRESKGCGVDNTKPVEYIGAWIKPTSETQSCVISNTTDKKYSISFKENNTFVFYMGSKSIEVESKYISDDWNFLTFSVEDNKLKIFVNGFLSNEVEIDDSFVLSSDPFEVSGCSVEKDNLLTDIEFANNTKTASTIRGIYEAKIYSQTISVNFRADLQSSDLILDSNDKEFSISEARYGSENTVENLNVGDAIIVKELIGEDQYMAQGEVTSVNKVTGKITVKEWGNNSTFPGRGFSVNSKVFKWQRVYIEASQNLAALREELGGLNFTKRKESQTEYIFKDFKLITPFEKELGWGYENILNRYLQYRIIFVTTNNEISPYITEVSIDYDTLGPSMEKVMRHGKWFDSGEKQSYWWAD